MIIKKPKCFYDEMKIIDKCMFSEKWLWNISAV